MMLWWIAASLAAPSPYPSTPQNMGFEDADPAPWRLIGHASEALVPGDPGVRARRDGSSSPEGKWAMRVWSPARDKRSILIQCIDGRPFHNAELVLRAQVRDPENTGRIWISHAHPGRAPRMMRYDAGWIDRSDDWEPRRVHLAMPTYSDLVCFGAYTSSTDAFLVDQFELEVIGDPTPEPDRTVEYPMVQVPGGPNDSFAAVFRLPKRTVPPHELGRTEVTREQWFAVMGTRPWERNTTTCNTGNEGPDRTAVCMTLAEARAFANALSERHGLVPVYRLRPDGSASMFEAATGYRLPQVAEWILALQAGTEGRYGVSSKKGEVCGHANLRDLTLKDNSSLSGPFFPCEDGFRADAPVASFPANPLGLHDVLGNVSEWLDNEKWDEVAQGVSSWATGPKVVSGDRVVYVDPETRSHHLGLRLARGGDHCAGEAPCISSP